MAAFLYFIDGAKAPMTRERIEAAGLGYAFDGVPYHAELANGPGGNRGVLLVDQPRLGERRAMYRAELQTWTPRRVQHDQKVFVGVYSDAAPTAKDLARSDQVDGPMVRLADGGEWQVPLVRHVYANGESESALPAYIAFDEHGKPIRGDVLVRYAALARRIESFWDAWLAAWMATPEDAEQFRFSWDALIFDAVALLGENYRVSLTETELLKLFTTNGGEAGSILWAACDCSRAIAFIQKKTDSGLPSIAAGDAA